MQDKSRQSKALSVAFWSAAVPFALGCTIFFLWSVTDWEPLMGLGLLNVGLGLCLFILGVGSLVVYFASIPRDGTSAGWQIAMGLGVAALLLLNFPICGAVFASVFRLEEARWNEQQLTTSSVRIVNSSTGEVELLKMSGAGEPIKLRSILGGESRSLFVPPKPGAKISFDTTHDGVPQSVSVQVAEEGTGQADIVVVVHEDGRLSAFSLPPQMSWMDD